MNLEERVRETLQEEAQHVTPPPYLQTRVIGRVTRGAGKKAKKRFVAGVLAAVLLLPLSAFSYQSLLADGVYGSFENIKKHIASATMEGYFLLNAKLSQAQGELGDEEYAAFKKELQVITDAKLAYGDRYGNIDYDLVPQKKRMELTEAHKTLQPYFDQLNNEKSSKEILTDEEFDQYIAAQMTYEKALAQSGTDTSEGPIEEEKLPEPLRTEFQQARDFLDYVQSKQKPSP
ncbi:DUF3600 domain-containing protein [Pseudobacillus badius]|uniref:DUF3600 domain-containing protein n=1 Tax=Bacillus badius TaxID=1455 RepID=UPI003CF0D8A0